MRLLDAADHGSGLACGPVVIGMRLGQTSGRGLVGRHSGKLGVRMMTIGGFTSGLLGASHLSKGCG